MSNRSLVELNHDYCPPYGDDAALLRWARSMAAYMGSADPDDLPAGVTRKHYRHHSEPCPMDDAKEAVKDIASRANAYVARIVR